jgi:hypothetical protein
LSRKFYSETRDLQRGGARARAGGLQKREDNWLLEAAFTVTEIIAKIKVAK